MSEPEQPKILSLEEVREAAESVRLRPKGEWAAAFVGRLCATVEHHAFNADTLARESIGVAARNVHISAELEDLRAENARLSALVTRLREALAEAGFPLEALNVAVQWEIAAELKNGIREALENHVRPVLADRDGVGASEELRLLRAWEAAVILHEAESRKCPGLKCSQELIAARLAKGAAWEALRAFREKNP